MLCSDLNLHKNAILKCERHPATIHIENVSINDSLSISSVDVSINGINEIINIKNTDFFYPETEVKKSYIMTQMLKKEKIISYLVVGNDLKQMHIEQQRKLFPE